MLFRLGDFGSPLALSPLKEEQMIHHRIATVFASGVLIVLAAGCAAERNAGEFNLAASAAAATASQLSGTWRGEMWPVGTDSTSVLNRELTLEIKDDATYRMTSARPGTGTMSNDSGVVVRDGGAVILKSSTGQTIRLQRSGDKLYGVSSSSRGPMHIMVEQAP
jgi:hypothetical protein